MKSEKIASKRVVWSIFILTIILVLALTFMIKNISFRGDIEKETTMDELDKSDIDSSVDENSQSQDESEGLLIDFFDFPYPINIIIWAGVGYIILQILFGKRIFR